MAKIKGFDALVRQFQTLQVDADKAIKKGLLKSAQVIKNDAKILAPKDKGELAASIDVEPSPGGYKIFAAAPHAPFEEFGTGGFTLAPKGFENYPREFFVSGKGKTTPKPFLFPALFRNQEQIAPNIEIELKPVLDKFNKK